MFFGTYFGASYEFFSNEDERLLLFYDAVRQQVILDGNSRYRFAGEGVRAYAGSFAKRWTGDGLVSRRLIGQAHDGKQIEVPSQVRELAVTGIDNAEKALALFFDNVAKSIAPDFADLSALIKRVVAVKMDYARKIARATDLTEATALQFAYCRSQVEITADLIG